MSITLHLPEDTEHLLRSAWGDNFDRHTLEAVLIEAYRAGHVSIGKLSEVLNLGGVIQAEQWLGQRGVPMNYGIDEYRQDCQTLHRLRAASKA